ncbi:MAG TPA: 30S ribosomal protein S17 [Euryarchaeota archaeon]|nr:30S ribosomal protein S17 [Euryarchaeota archaeon]
MRDIGVDVSEPEKECSDDKCPFHGSLKVRGQIIKGVVVADKMKKSVVVEKNYLRYIKKYERYERRKSRIFAHNPVCISAKAGDDVKIMECKPISKGKSFVVIEKGASP